MKKIIIDITTLNLLLFPILLTNHTSALTYQNTYHQEFTFNPSISLSLSSADLTISDLSPGTYTDSNIITITTNTNSAGGYTLLASVGNSTYSTTSLTQSGASDAFISLTDTASLTNLGEGSTNTWGYATSSDDGSTWSNYSGLPIYNASDITTGAKILVPTTGQRGEDSIQFKIAAYADESLIDGTYSNVINFIAMAEAEPVSFDRAFYEASQQPNNTIAKLNNYYKMQDISSDICSAVTIGQTTQLIDTRDDNAIYYVGKLKDGRCWMLDNLRLGSNNYSIALTPSDTNISSNYTLPQGITSDFTGYEVAHINAYYKNDTDVTSYGDGSGKVGVYYNYCAASAGAYCYASGAGTGDASYDICPKNWRLPTGGSTGEYQTLYNNYDSTQTAAGSGSLQHSFATVLSGRFFSDTQYLNGYHILWTSTSHDTKAMYRVYINGTNDINMSSYYDRHHGVSIRCVANS